MPIRHIVVKIKGAVCLEILKASTFKCAS